MLKALIEKVEGYGFECQGGGLTNCQDWQDLKARVLELHARHPQVESQATIQHWAASTFGDPSPQRAALRSLEEMIELCVAAGVDEAHIEGLVADAIDHAQEKTKGMAEAPAEIADVVITLYQLARVLPTEQPVDVQAEVDKKMAINRARKWALDGQGSGQHVGE